MILALDAGDQSGHVPDSSPQVGLRQPISRIRFVGRRSRSMFESPKRLNGAHAKSLLRERLERQPSLSTLLELIPDGMNVRYPFTDLFWALFRRS